LIAVFTSFFYFITKLRTFLLLTQAPTHTPDICGSPESASRGGGWGCCIRAPSQRGQRRVLPAGAPEADMPRRKQEAPRRASGTDWLFDFNAMYPPPPSLSFPLSLSRSLSLYFLSHLHSTPLTPSPSFLPHSLHLFGLLETKHLALWMYFPQLQCPQHNPPPPTLIFVLSSLSYNSSCSNQWKCNMKPIPLFTQFQCLLEFQSP